MTHLPSATFGGTLRERFVADMAVREFTEKTRKDYLRYASWPPRSASACCWSERWA